MRKVLIGLCFILILLFIFAETTSTTNNDPNTTSTSDYYSGGYRYDHLVNCKTVLIEGIKEINCLLDDGKTFFARYNSVLRGDKCKSVLISENKMYACLSVENYFFISLTGEVSVASDDGGVNSTLATTNSTVSTDNNLVNQNTATDFNYPNKSDINSTGGDLPTVKNANTDLNQLNKTDTNFQYRTTITNCDLKYINDKNEIVCRDSGGELTTAKNTELSNLNGCSIVIVNGERKDVCETKTGEVIVSKPIVDVNEMKRCKLVQGDNNTNRIICVNASGEIYTPSEKESTNYSVTENGLKYNISKQTKEVMQDKNTLNVLFDRLQTSGSDASSEDNGNKGPALDISEKKVENYERAVKEKMFKVKRELVVEKIVEEEESYKSTFYLKIKNDSQEVLELVSLIEVIPKGVAVSASEISSDYNFIILEDDPILEFIIPTLSPGEEAEVAYFVGKEVLDEPANEINSAVSFEGSLSIKDCVINTANSEYFGIIFDIDESFITDINVGLVIPYQEECMSLQNVTVTQYVGFDCGEAILSAQDAIFENIGLFTYNEKRCTAQYTLGKLILNFWTKADIIVGQLSGNAAEILFDNWNFVDSNAESMLKIILPSSVELVSFYPKADPIGEADYGNGFVSWTPIPRGGKNPTVRYSVVNGSSGQVDNSVIYVIIGLVVFIAVIGIVVVAIFNKNSKSKKTFNELHLLNVKMKQLEKSYLVGKIDEITYRRLMEQYQLQRNDLQTQIKDKAKPVEKPKVNQ